MNKHHLCFPVEFVLFPFESLDVLFVPVGVDVVVVVVVVVVVGFSKLFDFISIGGFIMLGVDNLEPCDGAGVVLLTNEGL